MRTLWFVLVVLGCLTATAATAEIESYAIVQDDGSLVVRGKTVRLFGVYIPQTGTFCGRRIRPARCGTRAAVALDFKIQRFVRCQEMGLNSDGSIAAYCQVNYSNFEEGEDLGAYLISRGLALALPEAPFEYHAMERIARTNGRGVWGFQADSFSLR